MSKKCGEPVSSRCGMSTPAANRQLIAHLLPTADRSLFVRPNRQRIALPAVGPACLQRALRPLSPLPPARVPSVGNRPRPHHGGTHARRICGTPTCHRAPPWRPACPAHLSGAGPLHVLVPQVVASLPGGGRRGTVRPHPRHPPRRPTHRA